MSTTHQLQNYKRFLLNRVTCTPLITEYIENCLAIEDEAVNHTFHKILIHNWPESLEQALNTISEYYSSTFVPVNVDNHGYITSFFTSSLHLILKIIKFDFIFPFSRNMFNIDILFNYTSSYELFGSRLSIEEIVSNVVSNRFTDNLVLDLTNFCNDKEFIEKKIYFYKVNLLAQFKILMLRIGKDTKLLNLSNNELSQPPLDILNFFIKGDLIAINLSHNNIPSISELVRVSSKIESLWVEGNPLCEDIDVLTYIKNIILKFPRLSELDGVKIKQFGIMCPLYKNFLVIPDKKTKMIVEKFLTLYYSHYDASARVDRKKIEMFYDINAKLTISIQLSVMEGKLLPHLRKVGRNILNPAFKKGVLPEETLFNNRSELVDALCTLRETVHDPSTFTIDVLVHDKKCMVLVVDGIFKECASYMNPEKVFQFRRTFVFNVTALHSNSMYHITNDLFSISLATQEQAKNSFKNPIRNMNSLALIEPDNEDVKRLSQVLSHLTNLKKSEAEIRLKAVGWDIKEALTKFVTDLRNNHISPDKFIEDDNDISDMSSLMDDID